MKSFKNFITEVQSMANKKSVPLDVPLPATGIKIGTIVTLPDTYDRWNEPSIKMSILKKVMAQSANNTAEVFGIPNKDELFITNDAGVTVATIPRHSIKLEK